MKLKFQKDDNAEITVTQLVDGNSAEFSYVDLIKSLYENTKLEEAEISDVFSEAESGSISRMIELLNEQIATVQADTD